MSNAPPAYAPGTVPSTRFEDHDFALYYDGVRVAAKPSIVADSDGIGVRIVFATSRGALADPRVDAGLEVAWGGWKPGDSCHLHQPTAEPMPENGFVIIESIEPAKVAGEETYFVCVAMTPVFDWESDTQVCGASEKVAIPFSWFAR